MKKSGWQFPRQAKHLLSLLLSFSVVLTGPAIAQSGEEIIPDFYNDPGLYPNREYINQNFNEQIDPFSGALQHHYVDLHLPGNGGFDLKIIRAYNSSVVDKDRSDGMNLAGYHSQLGLGWTLHFGRILKQTTNAGDLCFNKSTTSIRDNPVLELPDGSRQILTFPGISGQPQMLTAQYWRAECSPEGSGLLVYSPDGTRYYMDHHIQPNIAGTTSVHIWYTNRIVDRNGNTATINYIYGPQIGTITTSDGRTITFTYDGTGWKSRLIEISAAGQTYRYNYQNLPGTTYPDFLTSVTRPDGTQWQYEYNPASLEGGGYAMKRVTYPEGGSIDYEYVKQDMDRVNSTNDRISVFIKKTLSTGGTWTFAYTPGLFGVEDKTVVTTPSGTITYQHYGTGYGKQKGTWQIGLLRSKKVGDIRSETYTWDKQQISGETNNRPGELVENGIHSPILKQKAIVLHNRSYITAYAEYDKYGNPGTISKSSTSSTSSDGTRTIKLTYNINPEKWIINQVKSETRSSGAFTEHQFDSNGNLTRTGQDNVITRYTYDAEGNVASVSFPRNLTHYYSNYKRGIP